MSQYLGEFHMENNVSEQLNELTPVSVETVIKCELIQ